MKKVKMFLSIVAVMVAVGAAVTTNAAKSSTLLPAVSFGGGTCPTADGICDVNASSNFCASGAMPLYDKAIAGCNTQTTGLWTPEE